MTTTPTSGAAGLRTAAQAVVDRWDTPLWKDVPATAEYIGRLRAALAAGQATAAPARPAAQQEAAYAALPDEREMLKHALWLASSFTVHRYMMSNAEGRWSGAEKATCHDELCCLYVAVFRGVEVDRVRVDFEADWMAVHDATQELTDHMDVAIGFPLKGVPDYESLAPKFFAYFHRLATHTLRASHGQAPAQPATVHCKGRNCAAVDGDGHSDECVSDHERAASGLDTAGNRNPVARYDGYRGAPCNPAYTKDQQAAWLEGYEARNRQGVTPSPQADSVQDDAARYRWLCCKFGETRFPCALENWLEHGYIADGKPSIDAAIDAAIKQGEKQ